MSFYIVISYGYSPPSGHDEYFIAAGAKRHGGFPQGGSHAADGDCGNNDKSMRHRPLVGNGEVDAGFKSVGRNLLQAAFGTAGQFHRRTPARQVHNTHVAPPDAGTKSGAERFGAGFLRGETLGVGLNPVAPFVGLGPFDRGEDAVQKAVAVPLDDGSDAARVGDI